MNSKEEKFFNDLSLFCRELNKAGAAFEKVNCGKMDAEEGRAIISDSKKKLRNSMTPLLERVYKVYKKPAEIDFAKIFLFKAYGIINGMNEVIIRLSVCPLDEPPKNFEKITELVRDALEEIEKIVNYTSDISANYMKMEARCRKIYAFEERGDEIYKDLIRDLFTGEYKPEYIIYWKEILSETEKMLDATAGSVSLLQRLFTRE